MKPKLLITNTKSILMDDALRKRVSDIYDVTTPKNGAYSYEQLLQVLASQPFDAVLSAFTDRIDAQVLETAKTQRVKIISTCATGVDNIDIAYAKTLNIKIARVQDVLTDDVADLTILLILAAYRKIIMVNERAKAGQFKGARPQEVLGTRLRDQTVGIIGLGKIGLEVVKRLIPHKVHIIYNTPSPKEALEKEFGIEYVDFGTLLENSNIISLHAPLNENTRHLIDAAAFAFMKKKPLLVNTARGALVEEKALITALKTGQISEATLDVFWKEPDIPKPLCKMNNVVLTSHTGSWTKETRWDMTRQALGSITLALRGQPSTNKPTEFHFT